MRIGTLTFHKVNNFGAVLQAYALQTYITRLGYDSEIIDYIPIKVSKSSKETIAKKVLRYLHNPKKQIYLRLTNKRFSLFRKHNLRISTTSYLGDNDIESNPPLYDVYIVGSDQVWNTELSNNSKGFYLHFVKEGKKLSYAASFGKEYINDRESNYINKYLRTFDSISVREKHHADLLHGIFNIDVEVTLDPVFLIDKSEWQKIEKPVKRIPKKYILVYMLQYSEELLECAYKKAKELNCDIVYISLTKERINGRVLCGIGPSEFLYVLSGATYICTNSFHGTAFSIIYNKDFSVVRHTSRNTRIDNILEILGLKERYYDIQDYKMLNSIDYELVNQRLGIVIQKSQKYLQDTLLYDNYN